MLKLSRRVVAAAAAAPARPAATPRCNPGHLAAWVNVLTIGRVQSGA